MNTLAEFIQRIDSFLERTGMSASGFGQAVLEDPCFVADLRGGREPRFSTIEKVEKYMRDYQIPGSQPVGNGSATRDPSRAAVG